MHDPAKAQRIRGLMKQALEDYSLHLYRPSNLHIIIQLNVLNAIADNATLLGFPKEALCRDELISPFHQVGPDPVNLVPLPDCPETLRPTQLQRAISHHPWIDLFPFPRFRDNVLRGIQDGSFDEDDLCFDLLGVGSVGPGEQPSLLVWGGPWDASSWEVNEAFLMKWGSLVRGCPKILESSNYWRGKRGQSKLSTGYCTEIDDSMSFAGGSETHT